jgi:hypothetical protein
MNAIAYAHAPLNDMIAVWVSSQVNSLVVKGLDDDLAGEDHDAVALSQHWTGCIVTWMMLWS